MPTSNSRFPTSPVIIPNNVKQHFVCLQCRKSVKRKEGKVLCPHCDNEMICLGKRFTSPRKGDESQWKKLEWLAAQGWDGWNLPTSPQETLTQTQETLKAKAEALRMQRQQAKVRASLKGVKRSARKTALNNGVELKRQEKYQAQVLAEIVKHPDGEA